MNTRSYSDIELMEMSPNEFRSIVRQGQAMHTGRVCRGYTQANLVIVPKDAAFEFLLFCNRNPRPCPILDVMEPGNPNTSLLAPGADLRTDLGKYRVYQAGKLVDEPTNIKDYWQDDLVSFLLGCKCSLDWLMRAANVKFRSIGVFPTNIPCVPAGHFFGHVAVSCSFCKNTHEAVRAIQISSRCPAAHGAPIHIGDPSTIGIRDIYGFRSDFRTEPPPPKEADEIALYWGCGTTPQMVAIEAKIEFMITHYPGSMFVTDKPVEELVIL